MWDSDEQSKEDAAIEMDVKIAEHLELVTLLTIQRMDLLGIDHFQLEGESDRCPVKVPKDYELKISIMNDKSSDEASLCVGIRCRGAVDKDAKPSEWGTSVEDWA